MSKTTDFPFIAELNEKTKNLSHEEGVQTDHTVRIQTEINQLRLNPFNRVQMVQDILGYESRSWITGAIIVY